MKTKDPYKIYHQGRTSGLLPSELFPPGFYEASLDSYAIVGKENEYHLFKFSTQYGDVHRKLNFFIPCNHSRYMLTRVARNFGIVNTNTHVSKYFEKRVGHTFKVFYNQRVIDLLPSGYKGHIGVFPARIKNIKYATNIKGIQGYSDKAFIWYFSVITDFEIFSSKIYTPSKYKRDNKLFRVLNSIGYSGEVCLDLHSLIGKTIKVYFNKKILSFIDTSLIRKASPLEQVPDDDALARSVIPNTAPLSYQLHS